MASKRTYKQNKNLLGFILLSVIVVSLAVGLYLVQQNQNLNSRASANRQSWYDDGKPRDLSKDARIKPTANGTYPWTDGGPVAAYRTGTFTTFFNKGFYWTIDESKPPKGEWVDNGRAKNLANDARIKPTANGTYPWSGKGPDSITREGTVMSVFKDQYLWRFDESKPADRMWDAPILVERDFRLKPATGGILPWENGKSASAVARRGAEAIYFMGKYMWVSDEAKSADNQWSLNGRPADLSKDPRIKPADDGTLPWSGNGVSAAWADNNVIAIFNGPYYWSLEGPAINTTIYR